MLRQAFSISSRALRSSTRSVAQQPLSRAQTFVIPLAVRRIQPAAARWYSEAPKDTQEGEAKPEAEAEAQTQAQAQAEPQPEATPAPEAPAAAEPAEDPVIVEWRKKFEAKDKEAAEWKDKCIRTIADFRNLQDRTARQSKAAREFAIQSFAKDLLDTVDNLDRALAMVPEAKLTAEEKSEDLQDLVNLCEGLKMTDKILHNTIKKHGLERFDPTGEKFDPNEHEALFHDTTTKGKEDGTITYVEQKGFKLNGRILRAAKVGIVKNTQ